jgi:serine phosphatase RsbU (regulator of sigma subunit)/anti-sigma regulatory factor (Ser/Thr protein kinase)
MMLQAILQRKPEIFERLADHWRQVTGGQLLVIDEAGGWVTEARTFAYPGNGVLSENWREWLTRAKASQQPVTFEGKPVQITALNVQDVPVGYLMAIGEASFEMLRWSAETLEALIAAEQALQGMTDELIGAWDQLELVCRVTQSLASASDLISVLRSILAEVRRVLNAGEGFLILEQDDNLTYVSVGGEDRFSPQRRQLYHRLQRAQRLVLCDDVETLREFWSDAPEGLTNLLGLRLPTTTSALAVVGLTNKGGRGFTAGDGKLLTAVAGQIAAIINNTLLHQQVLAQERMQRELEIAAEIQISLLPRGLPEIPGVEFAVASLPATEVGGDFYDFIFLNEDCLGIVVGDVAGKGVPAAMLTSLARTILRVEAGYGHSPQRVITQTNHALLQDLQHAEMFVTALVACLNRDDLTLTYANAGHTPGLWWRADLGTFELLTATTPPLGIQIADEGNDRTLQLSPGDFVVFYTDGVTEAMSLDSQIFGGDRLKEALTAHARGTADDLVQSVLSAVRAFRRGAPRSDDLTMIVMKVNPSATSQHPQLEPAIEFGVPADLQSLENISRQVTQVCRSLPDLPPPPTSDDFVYLVELAVSEICTNIIQHSYLMVGGEIRGSLTSLANGIQIDLYDDGESFDPTNVPEPSSQFDSLNEGGYGLHIVRQIMDSVQYQPNTPKGNHWRLIKYLTRD